MNNTVKLLIATWILLAFLIGGGAGYLLGVKKVGVVQSPGQQGQFPPGNQGQMMGPGGAGQPGTMMPGGQNTQPGR